MSVDWKKRRRSSSSGLSAGSTFVTSFSVQRVPISNLLNFVPEPADSLPVSPFGTQELFPRRTTIT